MSPLQPMRRQLTRLRWYRWSASVSAALCALVIAILWTLLFLFAVDVQFELPETQRLAIMSLVAVTAIGLVRKQAAAGVQLPEDPKQLALLVERNHGLDSDLIAAMQFQEHGENANWGSSDLRDAVIHRAGELSKGLDFFHGVNSGPLPTRAAVMAFSIAVCVTLASMAPAHARVFWHRLWMGLDHYPTQIRVTGMLVNGEPVLDVLDPTLTPRPATCAEGQPVELMVRAAGRRPASGRVRLTSGGLEVEAPLERINKSARLLRLQQARQMLDDASATAFAVSALTAADCPSVALALNQPSPDLEEAKQQLDKQLASGEEGLSGDEDWYSANLPRHAAKLQYQLTLGDAWTESGVVEMIPLPAVALHATAEAPAYSKLGRVKMSPGTRQLRVLEGSKVELSVECVNRKSLESVWGDYRTRRKAHDTTALVSEWGALDP